MNRKTKCSLAGWFLAVGFLTQAKDIEFGGYTWAVRSGRGGPGPNAWEENNAWLDTATNLHLKISQRDGKWSCAEVTMQRRLGFGRYQFQTTGRLDRFDDNVVLGFFNYPTGDVGPDGTHEIDIEFARWGNIQFSLRTPASNTLTKETGGNVSVFGSNVRQRLGYLACQVPSQESRPLRRNLLCPQNGFGAPLLRAEV